MSREALAPVCHGLLGSRGGNVFREIDDLKLDRWIDLNKLAIQHVVIPLILWYFTELDTGRVLLPRWQYPLDVEITNIDRLVLRLFSLCLATLEHLQVHIRVHGQEERKGVSL